MNAEKPTFITGPGCVDTKICESMKDCQEARILESEMDYRDSRLEHQLAVSKCQNKRAGQARARARDFIENNKPSQR